MVMMNGLSNDMREGISEYRVCTPSLIMLRTNSCPSGTLNSTSLDAVELLAKKNFTLSCAHVSLTCCPLQAPAEMATEPAVRDLCKAFQTWNWKRMMATCQILNWFVNGLLNIIDVSIFVDI